MKNIIAAVILAVGMIASTAMWIHHQNRQHEQALQEQACKDDRRNFDACTNQAPGAVSVWEQCVSAWQPQIDKDCGGK